MNRLLGYVYLAVCVFKLGVNAAVFSTDLHIVNAQLAPDSVERRYASHTVVLSVLPTMLNPVFKHRRRRRCLPRTFDSRE